jgi:hypothetical protein
MQIIVVSLVATSFLMLREQRQPLRCDSDTLSLCHGDAVKKSRRIVSFLSLENGNVFVLWVQKAVTAGVQKEP